MNGVVHMSMHDLQELSMLRCNLSGPLDPSLARLENLSVIVLDNNNLSSPVPETFSHFKNLKILRLYECELTGTFPQKIFNIRTLSYLDISWNNNLHGFLPEFPSSGSLYSLSVSHTNFSGPIPFSIGNMRNLSELDLSICGFNGIIPNSLSNLTKLSYLDLSLNSFTGPMTLFSVPKKLSHLGLSNNDLSGLIPSSHFEGMHNLFEIDLSYNSFTGSIPSSLFALPSLHQIKLSHKFSELDGFINVTSSTLEILDISNNNLSGTLAITCLSHIMSLSNNTLHDNISYSLCNASYLQVLDLSINSISGTIPSCLMMMMNGTLEALNLKNNNLSGPIPNTVPVSCGLWTLSSWKSIRWANSKVSCLLLKVRGIGPWIKSNHRWLSMLLKRNIHASCLDFEEQQISSVEMGFDFWPRSYFWSTLNLEAMEAMVLATCAQIRYVLVATVSGRESEVGYNLSMSITPTSAEASPTLRIGRNEMLSYAVPLVFGTLLDLLQRIAQSAPTSF
ncbi:hypothetical protein JHK87_006257 [Glycine soja]|nr:hypothetical protein JHK87_006257 [Glycine soja]